MIRQLAAYFGFWLLLISAPLHAQGAQLQEKSSATQCEALVSADFSLTEDAPSKVLTATLISGVRGLSTYCEVIGYTWHNAKFRVRLPTTGWNGKLVVFGTGGQAGDFLPDDPISPISSSGSALREGFATATHDGGHVSSMLDAQWAFENEPALLDYAFRAPHVTGLIARAIVRKFYGKVARLAYYSGCSNGGREALQMAQRYPYDYNGIVAGAPSMLWSKLFANLYWFSNRVYGKNAVLDSEALNVLHRYVIEKCDLIDGRSDGIIDDPRKCHVDLTLITCKPGSSGDCLRSDQANAAHEIYDGPHSADGRRIAYSSAMPGSELVWNTFSGIESYPSSVFRYESFMPAAGPGFVPDEADLSEYVQRSGGSDALLSADNPDLHRFKNNGGKLLSYMGWADPIGDIRDTLDYHSTVERVIGSRKATEDFYRLFMVPGMNHCTGGDGAYQIDWLVALDAWVDRQKAPDSISGYHPDANGKPAFSRTVTPLPSDNDH